MPPETPSLLKTHPEMRSLVNDVMNHDNGAQQLEIYLDLVQNLDRDQPEAVAQQLKGVFSKN